MEMINIFALMNEVLFYDPFKSFDLVGAKCFLTGVPVSKGIDKIDVFPKWLMESEDLYEKAFKLLDESFCTYQDLFLGVSNEVAEKINVLNEKSNFAFNTGDKDLLTDTEWFQWAGVMVYGLVSAEIRNGLKSDEYKEDGFKVSPVLVNKFRKLHNLLQSLLNSFEWDAPLPFSLFKFSLLEEEGIPTFEHRNEINTLTFSFRYKKVGVILCLLDNELNKEYHQPILLDKYNEEISLVQFEEIAARVYYSNYLLSIIPDFSFTEHNNTIYVTNVETAIGNRTIFEPWVEKTYAQVLEAFWKPWNYSRIEILKNPEKAITFLS